MSIKPLDSEADPLAQHILNLEVRLLMGPDRYELSFLEGVLRADFSEMDARGRATSRADVIQWLLIHDENTGWTLQDFTLQRVSEDVVISHYRASKTTAQGNSDTLHTGVWHRDSGADESQAENHTPWQLVFHQGTYAPSPSQVGS